MLKIAICDDETDALNHICALAEAYAKSRPALDISFQRFPSPQGLLQAIKAGERFELYLLDILMPEIDGIDIGMQIRQRDSAALIIYLTASSDYALDSYQVKAQDYLLKPFKRSAFFTALDQAVRRLEAEDSRRLLIRAPKGVEAVPFYQILYVESYHHRFFCTLTDGRTIESRTQRERFDQSVEPLLRDGRFVQTSVSYVVNMQHIRAFTAGSCRMTNGAEIPITRAFNNAKQIYLDYLLERGQTP